MVCDEYPPCLHGGIGSVSRDLAEGFVQNGHKVTVAGVYKPNVLKVEKVFREQINGVNVVRLPPVNQGLPYRVRLVRNRLRLTIWLLFEKSRTHIDVIEVPDYAGLLSFGGANKIPMVCRSHGSKKYIDALYGKQVRSLIYSFEGRQFSNATELIFVSEFTAKTTLNLYRLNTRRYAVIYNAVDADYFSPSTSVPVIPGKIVFVNSITPNKGVDNLIRAMNILGKSYPEATLYLIGKQDMRTHDGRIYSKLLFDIIDSDLNDRIHFLGHVSRDEVLYHLRTAHLCCFPSYVESFAISPLEAMAVGKPTVFTKNASGPEAIEDSISGLLCDPDDPVDIANKIAQIFDHQNFALALGKNARMRVLDKFDKRKWININLNFYSTLLNS